MPLIEDMQLQGDAEVSTAAAAITTESNPPLRRSSRLAGKASCSNDGIVAVAPEPLRSSRRAATNAKKKMLRKAGVYGDPNRAHNERKLEITYLREKVGQLETELHSLQEHSSPTAGTKSIEERCDSQATTVSADEASVSQVSSTPSAWGNLLLVKKQREESERENVRLKLILASQIKVAKVWRPYC